MLNVPPLALGLGTDHVKRQGAVVRRAAEHRLRQRRQVDLHVQEGLVALEQRVLAHVARQHVVRREVAAVEGEEQIAQPGVRRRRQAVEDRVQQQLAEVVDRVGHERRDGEVVGAGLPLGGREVVEGDAGEVEEGVFVVRGEFVLGLRAGVSLRVEKRPRRERGFLTL